MWTRSDDADCGGLTESEREREKGEKTKDSMNERTRSTYCWGTKQESQPAEYITVTDSRTAVYDAMRQPSIQDTTQTDAQWMQWIQTLCTGL